MNKNKNKDFPKRYTIKDLVKLVNGNYEGNFSNDHLIEGISSIEENDKNKITFAENKHFLSRAADMAKGVVLVKDDLKDCKIDNVIKVENVRLSYAKIAEKFKFTPYHKPGIHKSAVIEDNVALGKNVSINSNVYIGENTEIGDNTVIAPGVKISENVVIGKNVEIHPNVVIECYSEIGNNVVIEAATVIGSEGYGYITIDNGEHYHIPQLGNVVIEDDVEIGSSVTIDRGTQSSTLIGKGTKIDNQVQIGHNVKVGKNCLLVGQVGIAGSTILGDNVILAGQVGIIDHVELGDNAIVGAASIVTSDVPADSFYLGNPAQDRLQELKARAVRNKLPEYRRELNKLKK
ncbi:MAG: UDP-3-O-(3-hydroxymyristoyl)glucosamine N-acyltransferase [Halanaerobiales bacterium]|nr:UDP-3-O-(3-hydroxymyristoyl)glucosamine N-acyltransferase [Halanaerobiales bacterium]